MPTEMSGTARRLPRIRSEWACTTAEACRTTSRVRIDGARRGVTRIPATICTTARGIRSTRRPSGTADDSICTVRGVIEPHRSLMPTTARVIDTNEGLTVHAREDTSHCNTTRRTDARPIVPRFPAIQTQRHGRLCTIKRLTSTDRARTRTARTPKGTITAHTSIEGE